MLYSTQVDSSTASHYCSKSLLNKCRIKSNVFTQPNLLRGCCAMITASYNLPTRLLTTIAQEELFLVVFFSNFETLSSQFAIRKSRIKPTVVQSGCWLILETDKNVNWEIQKCFQVIWPRIFQFSKHLRQKKRASGLEWSSPPQKRGWQYLPAQSYAGPVDGKLLKCLTRPHPDKTARCT